MNREIKFKAWDKKRHKKVGIFSVYNMPDWIGHTYPEGERYIRRYKLFQYTGIKDRNNVEIYEGDIVKGYDRCDDIEFVGSVVFNNGQFMANDSNDLHQVHSRWMDYKTEIIGNTYEKSELLK